MFSDLLGRKFSDSFPQNGRIGYPVVYSRIGIPRPGAPVPLVHALVTPASICKSKNTGLLSPRE